MDEVLKKHLDVIVQDIHDDDDGIIVIFGEEGAGKSKIESQIAKELVNQLGTPFSIEENVHLVGSKQIRASLNSKKSVHCLDESRRTLNKRRTMTSGNQDYMDFLSECRSDNNINIAVLPTYFDLERDLATRRVKLLIKVLKTRHPVTKKLIRGSFIIINTKNKNSLKQLYKYQYEDIPQKFIVHRGKFGDEWGWNAAEYKTKKEKEKRAHYDKEIDEQAILTPREKAVVCNVHNYLKQERLLTAAFYGQEGDKKTFHRLFQKLDRSIMDSDTETI